MGLKPLSMREKKRSNLCFMCGSKAPKNKHIYKLNLYGFMNPLFLFMNPLISFRNGEFTIEQTTLKKPSSDFEPHLAFCHLE